MFLQLDDLLKFKGFGENWDYLLSLGKIERTDVICDSIWHRLYVLRILRQLGSLENSSKNAKSPIYLDYLE